MTVPLAVRVKNTRTDQMLTGYLHGGLKFQKGDPGGFKSASFVVSKRLGYRTDIIQPYSRIYVYNQRNGDTVFEGDVSHPGRSVDDSGELLEVQVEGGVERLNDWSGARIWVDREMQEGWVRSHNATGGSEFDVGLDRGGSGADAIQLSFPNSFHVESLYRSEIAYYRLHDAGQQLGAFNYNWDGGHTSGSPGWLVRSIADGVSSDLVRSEILNISGAGRSQAEAGSSFTAGNDRWFLQLVWTSGSSNTGTLDNVWASILDPVTVARLHYKDGSFISALDYQGYVTAAQVWEDMLGDMLAVSFDSPNAQVDAGTGYQILQLAYPDGVTPMQVADALMAFEPGCTYIVGPSKPGVDKYSIKWMNRSNVPRYEFSVWADDYSASAQTVDQFDVAVARWKAPTGVIRTTVTTQSIPEMTAAGRSRRFYQDLTDSTSNEANAAQANASVLNDHRFPQNGGRIIVSRSVVDLWTGRRVQPYEIEPAYIARIVGINPSRDALNNSPRNGSSLCRIVNTDYDADSHSVSIDLDSEPWSMYRAIANAKTTVSTPQRKAF